ncbi:MAG: ATP-binding protein [Synergistaceae bacterium]|jgi:anti-sigma regulatory factor (Ser/Thr protein kinase)|nr:ATP-binding protein [Synergistaceae bacterium]
METIKTRVEKSGTFRAEMSEIENIYVFISRTLSESEVDPGIENLFMLAVDEIFSNIVKYGFDGSGEGATADISIQIEDGAASLTFRDGGKPFDPLSANPPDVLLGLDEKPVGGLGVYIVKNSFDEVRYSREDDHNVFTLKKYLR